MIKTLPFSFQIYFFRKIKTQKLALRCVLRFAYLTLSSAITSFVNPARRSLSAEGKLLTIHTSKAQEARPAEHAKLHLEQFQDPDNEYGLFAGASYEQTNRSIRRWMRVGGLGEKHRNNSS